MIHPIIWGLIAAHPFISYAIAGLVTGLVAAYLEGRYQGGKEPSALPFMGGTIWPLLWLIGLVILFGALVQKIFEAGRDKNNN